MDGRPVYVLAGRRGGKLAALFALAARAGAAVEVKVEEPKGSPMQDALVAVDGALQRALREEKVRSRKHYAVTGTYAEVHRNGKVAVVKRRTINAPIGKYDDAPRGGGAKERARRAAAMAKTQETGASNGNAAGAGEQQG